MRTRREFGQGGRRAGGRQEVLLYFALCIYIIPSFLCLHRGDRNSLTLPSPTTSLPVPQETLVQEREAKGQALLACTWDQWDKNTIQRPGASKINATHGGRSFNREDEGVGRDLGSPQPREGKILPWPKQVGNKNAREAL